MRGVFEYIFPNRCVNCTRIIHQNPMPLCLVCYDNLAYTHWELDKENLTYQLIQSHVQVHKATSMLQYKHGNVVQKLIMANKYYNQQNIGVFMADLAFPILSRHDFDVIVCIPSHNRTIRQRGYNQVEAFSRRLAELIEVEFNHNILHRVKRRDSQTHKNWKERHHSLTNAFTVSDDIQKYQNVLLLDDVLTSGATLSSCCQAILAKKEVNLSIFTMAKAF